MSNPASDKKAADTFTFDTRSLMNYLLALSKDYAPFEPLKPYPAPTTKEKNDTFLKGASMGYDHGYDHGFDEGFTASSHELAEQLAEQAEDSWDDGFSGGWDEGYDEGFADGVNNALVILQDHLAELIQTPLGEWSEFLSHIEQATLEAKEEDEDEDLCSCDYCLEDTCQCGAPLDDVLAPEPAPKEVSGEFGCCTNTVSK